MAGSSTAGIVCVKEEEIKNNLNIHQLQHSSMMNSSSPAAAAPEKKKKRNQPGTPNPDAEVVALSPETLMATNRFICEVCNKGFQREQNLQLHRRGHNLPWKLKQKASCDVRKKVYLCPEPTCVHHDPTRALGDLTGIKKHFSRKHGQKRFKCDKCNKKYAVHSDWKAHSKTCGTKEYRCDCGTTFSRRDSFVSHRAYCEALAQETARHSYIPASLSSIAATIYANASSAPMTFGSTPPTLMSMDHPKPSSPVFELSAPAAASRPNSFTDLLSGESVGSAFRPIQQLTAPVQPPEPKLMNYQFSQFQGFINNIAPAGPVFNLDSPQNYEDDLKINNNIGLFTGLMMNADAPVYGTPQLSATALLQKAALAGSSSSSADLMKSLGSSSTGGVKFTNYGGVFGDAMSGVGAGAGAGSGGGAYHELYNTINAGVTAGSYGNGGGYGVGMEISEINNAYGPGIMYNAKLDDQENNNIALEMSVQRSGYRDNLTRDFLGMGKRMKSLSGEVEDNKKTNGHGMELNSPDSEATTSTEPKLPVGHWGP